MIITKESERLSYMINNILDFSKIEMGRKEFNPKPGNLAEVVEFRRRLEKADARSRRRRAKTANQKD